MTFFAVIRQWLEFLNGASDAPPPGLPGRWIWLVNGFWWAILGCLIALFCGQASKFIYIDF